MERGPVVLPTDPVLREERRNRVVLIGWIGVVGEIEQADDGAQRLEGAGVAHHIIRRAEGTHRPSENRTRFGIAPHIQMFRHQLQQLAQPALEAAFGSRLAVEIPRPFALRKNRDEAGLAETGTQGFIAHHRKMVAPVTMQDQCQR